ncbi:MAG: hypothetical protein GDA36_03265 [Rhodobacteraceae bacterium]|nr:hypothetical protein [Paracoccaceae bacterium]
MRTNHINLGGPRKGVQGWFDGPVVAWFVSNADRIGADDVLSKIDAPVDWRWCSPTCKHVLNVRLDFMLFCDLDLLYTCARCDDPLPFSQRADAGWCSG